MNSKRYVISAVAVSTMCIVPAFLTGAMGVQLGREFDVGADTLGLWVAVFFISSGMASPVLGRLAESWGPATSLRRASGLAAVALVLTAVAPTPSLYIASMIVGGVANALAHPSANLSLSRAIHSGRLGLAFGIKQSAVPSATLLAGTAVPVIALTVGWRWAFVLASISAVVAMMTVPDDLDARRHPQPHGENGRMDAKVLVAFTVAGALGGAAAVSLAAFGVPGGVALGVSEAHAGLIFAVASLCGLLGRLTLGWGVDRRIIKDSFRAVMILLAVGSIGFAILAAGGANFFTVGVIIAFLAGWTWPGLFHMSIVRDNPDAPASATGIVQIGLSLGSGVGPLAFGVLVTRGGYRFGWAAAAVATLAASVATAVGWQLAKRPQVEASVKEGISCES